MFLNWIPVQYLWNFYLRDHAKFFSVFAFLFVLLYKIGTVLFLNLNSYWYRFQCLISLGLMRMFPLYQSMRMFAFSVLRWNPRFAAVLRIRDPVRMRIRDGQLGSYFRELRNHFFGLIYLNSLMRIRALRWKKFGSGINIPDPPHCFGVRVLIRIRIRFVRDPDSNLRYAMLARSGSAFS